MPAGLPAAPWLNPPDVVGSYQKGVQLGLEQQRMNQQIAMEQQRLNQQSQQVHMEMEARRQEHERSALMEQQKMEIEKAYHQSQIGLKQQQLQEVAKVNQEKIKQFAMQSQAKLGYEKRVNEIKSNPSLTPEQQTQELHSAIRDFGVNMANTSNVGSLVGALEKTFPPQQAPMPRVDAASGALVDPRGVPHWKPKEGQSEESIEFKNELGVLANLREKQAAYPAKSTTYKSYQTQIDDSRKRLEELRPKTGGTKQASSGKKLDETTAMWFLNETGGDKEKARQLAKDAGYDL